MISILDLLSYPLPQSRPDRRRLRVTSRHQAMKKPRAPKGRAASFRSICALRLFGRERIGVVVRRGAGFVVSTLACLLRLRRHTSLRPQHRRQPAPTLH